jgi:DNA repair protein RadA/Sms
VLDKRAGLNLSADDVFVNVAGGISWTSLPRISPWLPPLRRACAIAPYRRTSPSFGEIGLAGEVRTTTQAGLRAREARQLGFTRCVMPDKSLAAAMCPMDSRSSASGRWEKRSRPCCSIWWR